MQPFRHCFRLQQNVPFPPQGLCTDCSFCPEGTSPASRWLSLFRHSGFCVSIVCWEAASPAPLPPGRVAHLFCSRIICNDYFWSLCVQLLTTCFPFLECELSEVRNFGHVVPCCTAVPNRAWGHIKCSRNICRMNKLPFNSPFLVLFCPVVLTFSLSLFFSL